MKLFTWWDGATIGTSLFSAFNGEHVGTDAQGNKYYRVEEEDRRRPRTALGDLPGCQRCQPGAVRMARLAASFVRCAAREPPDAVRRSGRRTIPPMPPAAHAAYRPQGALERGGRRARATGDYEAWTPDA